MKLGLGTVQFGMDYGISNRAGQTSAKEVVDVLSVAHSKRVQIIDTAALYGSSEVVLGNSLPAVHSFKLVTKTIRFDAERITINDAALLEQAFERSLQSLRCSSLYGLLIHNADDLLSENGYLLMDAMLRLRQRGLVEKIGVSVYNPEQIDEISKQFMLDIIQLPVNIFDQRLIKNGQLARLKSAGIEIHARSIFLQGLLLMEPEHLHPYFKSIKSKLIKYHQLLHELGVTPVAAALGFATGLAEIDYAICGVNNHRQLMEICSDLKPLATELFKDFAMDCEEIINPALWRL